MAGEPWQPRVFAVEGSCGDQPRSPPATSSIPTASFTPRRRLLHPRSPDPASRKSGQTRKVSLSSLDRGGTTGVDPFHGGADQQPLSGGLRLLLL
jgi:hypothetical protein